MADLVRRRPLLRAAAIGFGSYRAGISAAKSPRRRSELLSQLRRMHARGLLTDAELAQQSELLTD